MKDIELPPLVGVLHALPDHIKTAIEAYGAACARMATKEVKHQAPRLCRGTNCGAVAGEDHSPECILEAAESQGWSNSPEAEAARAAVEADRAQRVPDGWKLEAAVAIDELLRLIRRNAPELSGKVLGNAQRVLDTALAPTPAPAQQEPSEAEMVCAEAYQVVGCLLSDLGLFETEQARKILDNLSEARRVHQDVLPWESAQHQEQPQQERGPMTDEEIERGRKETFSTENPFCPCDSKTMRKAVRWAEHHHGIRKD